MAITTADGIIAGQQYPRLISKVLSGTMVAGRPHSLWGFAGIPGAGAFDTTLNGVTLSAPQNGQIPFTNPGAGNTYLNKFIASQSQGATLLFMADRLWHNGGYTITSTSAQNSTTPAWPARDANGSTNGEGVFLAVEVSAATGAGTPTITISYTNSAGTSGRSATNLDTTVASSIAGTFYRIDLQAGDLGVRSVQSLTLSATWTSGTINLVAYRPIGMVETTAGGSGGSVDTLSGGLARIYNDSVLWPWMIPSQVTSARVSGMAQWTQG